MCNLEVVCFNLEEVQLVGMKMIGNSDSEENHDAMNHV